MSIVLISLTWFGIGVYAGAYIAERRRLCGGKSHEQKEGPDAAAKSKGGAA